MKALRIITAVAFSCLTLKTAPTHAAVLITPTNIDTLYPCTRTK